MQLPLCFLQIREICVKLLSKLIVTYSFVLFLYNLSKYFFLDLSIQAYTRTSLFFVHFFQVGNILSEATEIFTKRLKLDTDFLVKMKSKGALTSDEVERIQAGTTEGDKVNALMTIMSRKPVSTYRYFKGILKVVHSDLYSVLDSIEGKPDSTQK